MNMLCDCICVSEGGERQAVESHVAELAVQRKAINAK